LTGRHDDGNNVSIRIATPLKKRRRAEYRLPPQIFPPDLRSIGIEIGIAIGIGTPFVFRE